MWRYLGATDAAREANGSRGPPSKSSQVNGESVMAQEVQAEVDFNTDLGNARRLVKRHGKNIHFVPELGKWVVWCGSRWQIDNDGAIMRLAKETVEAMYSEAVGLANGNDRDALLKHAIRSQAEARLKAMVNLAATEPDIVLAAKFLDADPWLLGVQNVVINLKTGQFRSACREDLITKRVNVEFDQQAGCPEWLKFLDTITGSDRDLQSYIQRMVGYTLTGCVREEVMFVLYGTGCNGKSTFRETLHALLGDYALAADAALLTERKKPGGATEEIARLKGRRFVAVNETAENDKLNEARVKFITSQDMITARNLYGHLFDFFPTHKSFLTTNHKPIVQGTDDGIWRRLHLIPFTVTIDKSKLEKDFRERRLMPELSGILNWALAGLAAYHEQGLNPPKAVLASTNEYREDMDLIGQWIAECCEQGTGAKVQFRFAYNDYKLWTEAEVGWYLTALTFRRRLTERGFGSSKGTHGTRMVTGLTLKTVSVPQLTEEDTGKPTEASVAINNTINELLRRHGQAGTEGPSLQ
jgi:putative DNA primase/helicase